MRKISDIRIITLSLYYELYSISYRPRAFRKRDTPDRRYHFFEGPKKDKEGIYRYELSDDISTSILVVFYLKKGTTSFNIQGTNKELEQYIEKLNLDV